MDKKTNRSAKIKQSNTEVPYDEEQLRVREGAHTEPLPPLPDPHVAQKEAEEVPQDGNV